MIPYHPLDMGILSPKAIPREIGLGIHRWRSLRSSVQPINLHDIHQTLEFPASGLLLQKAHLKEGLDLTGQALAQQGNGGSGKRLSKNAVLALGLFSGSIAYLLSSGSLTFSGVA